VGGNFSRAWRIGSQSSAIAVVIFKKRAANRISLVMGISSTSDGAADMPGIRPLERSFFLTGPSYGIGLSESLTGFCGSRRGRSKTRPTWFPPRDKPQSFKVIKLDVGLHIPEVATPVDDLGEKKRVPEFSSVFHRLWGLPLSSLGGIARNFG
jgi:hypothetical protein